MTHPAHHGTLLVTLVTVVTVVTIVTVVTVVTIVTVVTVLVFFVDHVFALHIRAVREREPKHRPLLAVVAVADPIGAFEGADTTSEGEQTQARTSRATLRLLEGFENDRLVGVRQSDAGVFHDNQQHELLVGRGGSTSGRRGGGLERLGLRSSHLDHADAHVSRRAAVRVLGCVAHQTQQVVGQEVAVRDDVRADVLLTNK